MTKKRRRFTGILGVFILFLAPWHCSQKPESQPTETVELEFFQHKVEAVEAIDAIIAGFQEENPNIRIRQNYKPEYLKILLARMISGDAPDLFSNLPQTNDIRLKMGSGHLLNLTGQSFLQRVEPRLLAQLRHEGVDYVLPLSLNMVGVWYNQTIFDRLNLNPPQTYDAFIQTCQKLMDAGVTPITFTNKTPWTVEHYSSLILVQEFSPQALERFLKDLPAGKPVTDQDRRRLARVAAKIQALQAYGPEDAHEVEYREGIRRFAAGESAMYIQGTWTVPEILKANPELRLAAFVFPADTADGSKVIYGVDFAVAASATGVHRAAALKFIEFLSRADTAQIFADYDRSPSVISGVTTDTQSYQALVSAVEAGRSSVWPQTIWAPGITVKWRKLTHDFILDGNVDDFVTTALTVFSSN